MENTVLMGIWLEPHKSVQNWGKKHKMWEHKIGVLLHYRISSFCQYVSTNPKKCAM